MPLKPCLDCGALSAGTRCAKHAREKEAQRNASRTPRGDRYGPEHQALRDWWAGELAGGRVVYCRRGNDCLYSDRRVYAGDERGWDLGHPDELCRLPTAPEHSKCNRQAAGRLSHA